MEPPLQLRVTCRLSAYIAGHPLATCADDRVLASVSAALGMPADTEREQLFHRAVCRICEASDSQLELVWAFLQMEDSPELADKLICAHGIFSRLNSTAGSSDMLRRYEVALEAVGVKMQDVCLADFSAVWRIMAVIIARNNEASDAVIALLRLWDWQGRLH